MKFWSESDFCLSCLAFDKINSGDFVRAFGTMNLNSFRVSSSQLSLYVFVFTILHMLSINLIPIVQPIDVSFSLSETSSYFSGLSSSIFESSESSFGDSKTSIFPSFDHFLICFTCSATNT